MTLDRIGEIERLNNVSIYIYTLSNEDDGYTLHLARKSNYNHEFIPLLFLSETHVCLIKDLNKFVSIFTRSYQPINFLCNKCLSPFQTQEDQQNHSKSCTTVTTVKYPKEGVKVHFKKVHSLYPMGFAAFLDLEAFNRKN